MPSLFLAIVAVALLANCAAFATPGDIGSCRRFVQNGGMGQHVDKSTALTMCHDRPYRAKVLKAKASGK
jgi:hypothetical protein